MRLTLFIILLWGQSIGYTQTTDSIFTYNQFIDIVKTQHPVVYQANLKINQGKRYIQKAKGGFDPKLEGNAQQKYFDSKQYYSYLNAGLKIPTWFGINVYGGYQNNNGERLNPEAYTPDIGLWNAGISIDLGKGLFIDQRRAELKQAKIYANSNLVTQQLMINQLVYDANIAYWDWFKAANKVTIYREAKENATTRFNAIKQSALLGDKPFVDTLKAIIQVQNQQLKLEQALLDLTNKKVQLEIFLWQEGFIPLEMDDNLIPPAYNDVSITQPQLALLENIDTLVSNHPEIVLSTLGIATSKIDYRLKKEALKPTLTLKYNALSSPINDNVINSYSINDYNWGATFSYALFTRKERADVALTAIKINEQESKLSNKQAQVMYKIKAAYNTWMSTQKQVQLYTQTVSNYTALFDAELTLFNTGESALFMVNARDQNRIDSQLKLIEIIFTNAIANAQFNYHTVQF